MTPHQIDNPTTYVLGFAFDAGGTFESVCLMEKVKPNWQKGLLNGVGGKMEPGETEHQAMTREFREETSVNIPPTDWHKFFTMRFGNGAVVHCFTARLPDDQAPITMEEEEVSLYSTGIDGSWVLNVPIVPNLRWLIPMAYHELTLSPGERMLPNV
jgi:8-oxo-dGTP diphosphatase